MSGVGGWLRRWRAPLAISALTLLAYAGSLRGPFVFDDPSSIVGNPTIRSLWPPWAPLVPPPAAVTAEGRPILNYSLAVNYALGGTAVLGYHVTNVVIHAVGALALFGLTRRTLRTPKLSPLVRAAADEVALLAALLWALHPLQTEAVTYVIQRAESLMGMFYLLTLYACVRAADAAAPRRWQTLAIGCCALGMGTKEVMVSAPVMVWLYDRTFLRESFVAAWRWRRGLYLGLFATWLLLAAFVASSGGNRSG